jgi:nitroreductase
MGENLVSALHPLLASRWSPTTFDTTHELTAAEVDLLLEAARWAPSAGNSQPWAFIVGCRGDDIHRRLIPHLARSSARWAPTASLLLANLSHRLVEDTDWDYSEFALYDLGQAVAHMTVQARALDLHVRQFRAFDRDAIAAEFAVPGHWEVTTLSAIGRVARGDTTGDSPTLAVGQRERRPLDNLLWAIG